VDRRGIIDRRPSIVGPIADRIIGFFVGIFLPVVGVIPTAAAMFAWSRTSDELETHRRFRHALSVTMWSGVGSFVIVVLVATIMLALISAAAHLSGASPSASPLP
jgi:ABC-type Fe3+ transport system permease subunit